MTSASHPLVDRVLRAFAAVESQSPEQCCDPVLRTLEGMTGYKTRAFMNALFLPATPDAPRSSYLEVGTYKGSSFVSALLNNYDAIQTAVAIDDYSEFQGSRQGLDAVLTKHLPTEFMERAVKIMEKDCFSVDASSELMGAGHGPFDVYLYDGAHDYDSHRRAVTHFVDAYADDIIFIVDDWNWAQVRIGTRDGLADLANLPDGYRVIFEREVRLTSANEHTPMPLAQTSFWNGMAVFVLTKKRTVP